MAIKLKNRWLGVAIPAFLVALIGYGSHYFILSNFLSWNEQIFYQTCQTMIWVSYYLAIYTNPGTPPKDFKPSAEEWHNYCKKCRVYKPERAHHCKTCNQCVLAMDHHCPWTLNCVGHSNFPHFMRFLFWVIFSTAYLLFLLIGRIYLLWSIRHTAFHHRSTSEIIFICIMTPMDAFVLLTVSSLLGRCIYNQCLHGMTQIESWEMDRIQSLHYKNRLLAQVIDRLVERRPEILPAKQHEINKLLSKRYVNQEDFTNFPYDVNPWTNINNAMGPWYLWLWPWSKPPTIGTSFAKNELFFYDPNSSIEDMLMSLPWPPDGLTHHSRALGSGSSIETIVSGGEQVIRDKSVDLRDRLGRNSWYNDWGEDLSDFGVDTELE